MTLLKRNIIIPVVLFLVVLLSPLLGFDISFKYSFIGAVASVIFYFIFGSSIIQNTLKESDQRMREKTETREYEESIKREEYLREKGRLEARGSMGRERSGPSSLSDVYRLPTHKERKKKLDEINRYI